MVCFRVTLLFLGLFSLGELALAKASCVARWNEIGSLSISGLNTSSIQSKGSVSFEVSGERSSYILKKNRDGKILAKTPNGNANVELCSNGKTVSVTAFVFGIKKTADITSLGGGQFQIVADGGVIKAKVRR